MAKKIPKGWRELEDGQTLMDGDRFNREGLSGWVDVINPEGVFKYDKGMDHITIRKLPANPKKKSPKGKRK